MRSVDPGSLNQGVEDCCAQVGGMPVLQRALALASGGPDCVDDIGFQALVSRCVGSLLNLSLDGGKEVVDGAVEFGGLVEIGEVRGVVDDFQS